MRFKPLVMILLAVVFGGSAMMAGNAWLKRQASARMPVEAARPSAPSTTTLVVASSQLRYGDEVTPLKLRQVAWPEDAIPPGSFRTVDEVLKAGVKRVALTAIEPNEPVLQGKITGEGQRATLSALIEDGMGAVTIQVDEVVGLAGLVLPGDRVDIFATQETNEDKGANTMFTDRILRNVRVLAVGQRADERADDPAVVRAVTIEVDQVGAQKIALASRSARLSLMLRKSGEAATASARRMSLEEIGENASGDAGGVSVRVTRGVKGGTTYAVPRSPLTGVPADAGMLAGDANGPDSTGNVRSRPPRSEAAAQPARTGP
jgi:pilus assembly protein CpaB